MKPCLPLEALNGWLRTRRYDVTPAMIDLAVLAPDLLRWHLPTSWRLRFKNLWRVHSSVVLASYGGGKRKRHLYVERLWNGEFPGRPRLRFGGLKADDPVLDWSLAGRLTPHELHPLVRSSLFPKLTDDWNPPIFELEPVRVRCHGVWHIVEHRDGVLTVPHTDEEHRREMALRSLGGAMSGCSKALHGWLDGGWLPRRLREQRRKLFSRMVYGDTNGVVELLDQGLDPRVRDGRQRNLLHYLSFVDHDRLLDRLLTAGVDLEATDSQGWTPLYLAVHDRVSVEFIRALLAAGARTDVVDQAGNSLRQQIQRSKSRDVRLLLDEVERLGHTSVEPGRKR